MASPSKPPVPFSDAIRKSFPDLSESFDGFEAEVGRWSAAFHKARAIATYEEDRLRELGHLTARRQIGLLAAGVAVRVVDLASGLVVLANESQVQAAFAVSRAVMETAAVPAYLSKNVVPHLTRRRAQRVDEVLMRLSMGTDRGLDMKYTEDDGTEVAIDPIPVSSLIKALESEADRLMTEAEHDALEDDESPGATLRRLYSYVSDHTHPNFGAIHLASTITEAGMEWQPQAAWTDDTLANIDAATYLAMWVGRTALDEVLAAANAHPLVIEDKTKAGGA